MKTKKAIAILSFLIFMGLVPQGIFSAEKIIIGEAENVILLPWGIMLPARIDTGASLSALNVRDLRLEGKTVQFRLPEEYGNLFIQLPLVGWRTIKKAGSPPKRRMAVRIDICLGETKLPTLVTLCDRSGMKYPLLIGRKALLGNPKVNFIVDVRRSFTLTPQCP